LFRVRRHHVHPMPRRYQPPCQLIRARAALHGRRVEVLVKIQNSQGFPHLAFAVSDAICFAGTPPTAQPAGTFFVTTAPAAQADPAPTVTPGVITTCAPVQAPRSNMIGARRPSANLNESLIRVWLLDAKTV